VLHRRQARWTLDSLVASAAAKSSVACVSAASLNVALPLARQCVPCRRPLLLEPGESSGAPLMLQSKEQLKRGGDFIPGFKKSDQQVGGRPLPPSRVLFGCHQVEL
jgi:hypothetical protein